MPEIILYTGETTLVDDDIFKLYSPHTWYYSKRHGYAIGRPFGRELVRLHRLVMMAERGVDVDHINHNKLDNRRCNLRLCTRMENTRNMLDKPSFSKYKGVDYRISRRKWRARIRVHPGRLNLGHFNTETEAALACDAAARIHHKEFAVLNFPNCVGG